MKVERNCSYTVELNEDEFKFITIILGASSVIDREKAFRHAEHEGCDYNMSQETFKKINEKAGDNIYAVFDEILSR